MLDTFWILQISNTWDTYHFSDAIYGFLDLLFFAANAMDKTGNMAKGTAVLQRPKQGEISVNSGEMIQIS